MKFGLERTFRRKERARFMPGAAPDALRAADVQGMSQTLTPLAGWSALRSAQAPG